MRRVLISRVDQGLSEGVVRLTNGMAWRLRNGEEVEAEAGAVAEVLSSDGRRFFLSIAGSGASFEVNLARCRRKDWEGVEPVHRDLTPSQG